MLVCVCVCVCVCACACVCVRVRIIRKIKGEKHKSIRLVRPLSIALSQVEVGQLRKGRDHSHRSPDCRIRLSNLTVVFSVLSDTYLVYWLLVCKLPHWLIFRFDWVFLPKCESE